MPPKFCRCPATSYLVLPSKDDMAGYTQPKGTNSRSHQGPTGAELVLDSAELAHDSRLAYGHEPVGVGVRPILSTE
jgi:hypothetical protein